jgi:hypothetical protein
MPPQQQLRQAGNVTAGSGSTVLQEEALKAAAMGAGGALRTEPVSPIDKKSLMKALRCVSCTIAFWFCLNILPVAITA